MYDLHPPSLVRCLKGSADLGPEHYIEVQGRVSLKSVISIMLGPPPETTEDRTQTKDTHPFPGYKLKFLIHP